MRRCRGAGPRGSAVRRRSGGRARRGAPDGCRGPAASAGARPGGAQARRQTRQTAPRRPTSALPSPSRSATARLRGAMRAPNSGATSSGKSNPRAGPDRSRRGSSDSATAAGRRATSGCRPRGPGCARPARERGASGGAGVIGPGLPCSVVPCSAGACAAGGLARPGGTVPSGPVAAPGTLLVSGAVYRAGPQRSNRKPGNPCGPSGLRSAAALGGPRLGEESLRASPRREDHRGCSSPGCA